MGVDLYNCVSILFSTEVGSVFNFCLHYSTDCGWYDKGKGNM